MRENDIPVPLSNDCNVSEFLAKQAIESTERLGVRGIITDSLYGRTARNLAAFRGPNPVLAICVKERVQRLLALSYGVIPVFQHKKLQPQDQFVAAPSANVRIEDVMNSPSFFFCFLLKISSISS